MSTSKNRRLAAILFADIVGYTALMQQDEAHTLQVIKQYQTILEAAAQLFNGEILINYGDGSLMTFLNSVDVVKAAKQIQEQAKLETPVPLRIGIHVGEFLIEKGDIYGDGVNLAARIESLGITGAVLFSKFPTSDQGSQSFEKPWLRFVKGSILMKQGQYQEALNIYENFVNQPNTFGWLPFCYLKRVESYEKMGNTKKAIKYYDKFINIYNNCDPPIQKYVRFTEQHRSALFEKTL